MADLELMRDLTLENDAKIVMLVLDGLGGMPGNREAQPNSNSPARRTSTAWHRRAC